MHIFYTLGAIAATHASAEECSGSITVEDVYTNPYPGPSVANYLTMTQYVGEDSPLSYIDWINPGELVALGGDYGRHLSREWGKELLGHIITITIESKSFSMSVGLDGEISNVFLDGIDVTNDPRINASVEFMLQSMGGCCCK